METKPAREHLLDLQDRICAALEAADGAQRFRREEFAGSRGALARPRVLSGGALLERAAVNFSHTRGDGLPAAATVGRPQLAGVPFEAVSISLIVHPLNPFAPTTHANFRFFSAGGSWWFGGGFDLTPYYGFEEDAVHWHRQAEQACAVLHAGAHARFKRWCDEYFYLPHRKEARGIGGIFFDDLDQPDAASCWRFWVAASEAFLPAYLPILKRRAGLPYGERERQWQLLRRGRYVEFNLLYDRGTRYGLQAGGRIESILASLPPLARWDYNVEPDPGSAEERLLTHFLPPRDWLSPSH
jgi:coproporphyrinogen III oxidase